MICKSLYILILGIQSFKNLKLTYSSKHFLHINQKHRVFLVIYRFTESMLKNM